MGNDFLCPYCKGKLNIKGNILLTIKKENGQRGLICLSPKLGNYKTETHPDFKLDKGEELKISCPMCHANLAALEFNEHLAKILMVDSNHTVYEILFSGIAGEHCTYKIKEHDVKAYGEDSNAYMNYFGESPKF